MLRRLNSLSIKVKLILLVAVPTLCVGYLGFNTVSKSRATAAETSRLRQMTSLAVAISATVHESQKERGCTGVFVGSNGERFRQELAAQRRDTDTRTQALEQMVETLDRSQFSEHFLQSLTAAMAEMRRMKDHRTQVDSLSIPVGQATGQYTALHALFLDTISLMATQSSDGHMIDLICAYVGFLKGKERVGVERATLCGIFARDSFEPGELARLASCIATQDAYFKEFSLLATTGSKTFFNDKMNDPVVLNVANMRRTALERVDVGQFGVDATEWYDSITAKINLLKDVEDHLSGEIDVLSRTMQHEARRTQLVSTTLVCSIIIATVLGGVFTIRAIIRPINVVVSRVREIAAGDLTSEPLKIDQGDEIGVLAGSVDEMSISLRSLVQETQRTSTEVASAATEIAATSEEMAAGMQQQSSQTGEVSAAVAEMAASVQEVAVKSGRGREVMERMIQEMSQIAAEVNDSAAAVGELGRKSEAIGQIIGVINDIADQTNLLALNAAIEAARAGEHGRGFAVVADEVRKLAERTTTATKEIAESIRGIQQETSSVVDKMEAGTKRVSEGVTLARSAGDALGEIVASTQEQAGASEHISRNMERITAVTRESSDGASQAASAASQLSAAAEQLQMLVGRFRI